ncbi:PAS domain-containing protein [uncultured Lamprocystis sp.]|uniref:PAS domain-containing protein n=1 Tax=uncultured Lamprocystis sp. TaxID=543132 RepID=UPI0025F57A47|nr:PAS domain-containing protein [uncultured Lamprocystis sp.]
MLTERKRAEEALRESRALAESIVAAIPTPLVVLDQELRVVCANAAFYHLFRVTPAETQGRLLHELGGDQWNIPALRKLLMDIRGQGTTIDNYEVSNGFPRIGRLNASPLAPAAGKSGVILLAFADITGGARGSDADSTSNPLISQLPEHTGDQRPE